jgi:beta-glucosidase
MRFTFFMSLVTTVAGITIFELPTDAQKLVSRDELAYSPPHYPSPWMDPNAIGWEEAYAKAKDFVSQMTLLEKVNLTTGVG